MSEPQAKKAELIYKVLQTKGNLSLLEINILTGRSHQIRVQLSGIGLPIYGDTKYNKNTDKKITKDLALWAGRLEFIHPVTKEMLVFIAPPNQSEKPWDLFYLDKYFVR